MDPCIVVIPKNRLHNPFPHSLLRTKQSEPEHEDVQSVAESTANAYAAAADKVASASGFGLGIEAH